MKYRDMNQDQQKEYRKQKAIYRQSNEFFISIAGIRVNKLLNHMKTVGYLGRYNGTIEQKEKIIKTLESAFEKMKSDLINEKKKN